MAQTYNSYFKQYFKTDKWKAYKRKWYLKHKKQISLSRKKYYLRNRESILERIRLNKITN